MAWRFKARGFGLGLVSFLLTQVDPEPRRPNQGTMQTVVVCILLELILRLWASLPPT